MGRSSRLKKNRKDLRLQDQQSELPSRRNRMVRLSKIIAIVVGAVSLLSALLSFQSKFTVTPKEAVTANDPTTIPFEIVNESPYSVDWIRHSWEMHTILLADDERVEGLRTFPAVHLQERLGNGQAKTLFCPLLGKDGPKVKAVDLGLKLTYKPWFLPIEHSKEYRFNIGPDLSGKMIVLRRNESNEHKLSF